MIWVHGFRVYFIIRAMVFFSKVWLRPGLAHPLGISYRCGSVRSGFLRRVSEVLRSSGPLVPWSSGSLVPWSWSPGPVVPWSSGPRGFVGLGFLASVASWLLGFSGFVALGFLASRLRWLLGFSGLKQLHFQDRYMSLSPNSTCHFCSRP